MNKVTRMIGALMLAAAIHATAAQAQSVAGRWDGSATTQQGAQGVSIVLDSAASGWTGTATSDAVGTAQLFNISVKGDTATWSLTVQTATVGMQGTLSADRKTMTGNIWIDGNDAGTFSLKRAAAAPAKPPAVR
jgi:hypothetical protein